MKKKIVSAVMVVVMMFALMGCSVSKTVTKTETVTDANGKTTTTTTITTNQNGEKTETTTVEESAEAEAEDNRTVATLAFENGTGVDIYTLKFTSSMSDDWGDNVLGDNAPLADGETITFNNAFTYGADNVLWDLKIADENDHAIEFKELDVSQAADPEDITIVLSYDATEDAYTATVE